LVSIRLGRDIESIRIEDANIPSAATLFVNG